MKTIAFSVEGPIRGKARIRSRGMQFYKDPVTRAAENVIAWSAKRAMGSDVPFTGPIEIDIIIWMCPPQSWTKAAKRNALGIGHENRAICKRDWDNQGKLISDALNKIVYEDDHQITDAHIRRRYRDKPGADILIKALAA